MWYGIGGGSLSVNSFVLVVIVMSTPSSYSFERGLIQSHLFGDDSCCFKRVRACWRYPHSLACVDSLIPANVRMLLRVIRRRSCLCAAMIYAVLITSHTHIMFLDAHKVHGDSHRPFFCGSLPRLVARSGTITQTSRSSVRLAPRFKERRVSQTQPERSCVSLVVCWNDGSTCITSQYVGWLVGWSGGGCVLMG